MNAHWSDISIGLNEFVLDCPGADAGKDIAEMAAYLASEKAGFITGGEFLVDGGMTVGPRHSWDQTDGGPLLDALGISVEQAEEMRLAMQAEQDKS